MSDLKQAAQQAVYLLKESALVNDPTRKRNIQAATDKLEAALHISLNDDDPTAIHDKSRPECVCCGGVVMQEQGGGVCMPCFLENQQAETNAPEGASEGESCSNAGLGLAAHDCTCWHKFAVAPCSGINICVKCGLSEMVAKKQRLEQQPEPANYTEAKLLAYGRAEFARALLLAAAAARPYGLAGETVALRILQIDGIFEDNAQEAKP